MLMLYNTCDKRDAGPLSTMHVLQDDARQTLVSLLPICLSGDGA